MKKSLILLLLFSVLSISTLILGACSKEGSAEGTDKESSSSAPVPPILITAQEAKEMMDADSSALILDVRTLDEYNEGHIKGALLIPDSEISERALQEIPDLSTTILIYCRSGRRSALAAQKLSELGYTKVYDFGGIVDWSYETVK